MQHTFPSRSPRWWPWMAGVASVSSALLLAAPPLWANDSVAIKTLTEQARFWEGKGRGDLASAAWKRLLQIDPKNPDALAGLAQIEIDNNRLDAARALTDELKKTPQASKDLIKRIEGATTQKAVNTKTLDQARAAAKAGRMDEAVSLYRQLLDGRPMSGALALEYYQTLGGTSAGWDEARKGLEKLSADEPDNLAAALAYGQHLTYRAATRREGIRQLAALSKKPTAARQATDAWRKALIWLDATKSDLSLFQAYLSVQPGDAAIKARVAGLSQAFTPRPLDARTLALRDGFNALNVGDVPAAEKRFEGLLAANPRNTDALGGLGVVRLKQERFSEAEKLLADATRFGGTRKWDEALTSARFWLALEAGDAAMAAGDLGAARRQYQRAAQLDSRNERPHAALADLLVEEGRLADAERAYRDVLAAHPKSVDVLRGLAGVLVRLGKVDQALALAEGLSEAEREELGYGSLRAEQYRRKAVQLMAQGDAIGAMQQLEEALLWDPNSPWLRLELARLYHRAGAASEAFGLMDGLLQTRPDMPDALYAAALMSAEAKEWSLGLAMLDKIPAKARTREMTELQRRLWVRAQTGKADVLARKGQRAQAMQVLEQAQTAAGRDPDLLAGVAAVMLDLGDETRSLATMRSLLAQSPKPEAALLVQYAGLLLKARQDVELAAQLRQLYTLNLTPEQRKDADAIRWAYSVRQTDAQREAGNFSAAYEIAAQLLSEKPTDLAAQQALARLYTSAGDPARALAWYHQVLQQAEPDVPTLVAAGGAALAVGDLNYAQAALDAASQMAPNDPSVLSSLGRLARAQGKNRQAVALLQQAQQVTQAQAQLTRSGPIAVHLVDYSMPAAAPAGLGKSGAGSHAVPLIPNPLGGRPVGAGVPQRVRPLQPTPLSGAGQPYSQLTPQLGLVGGPAGESQMRPDTPAASVFSDAAEPRDRAVMRPVQYQPGRLAGTAYGATERMEAVPTYSAAGATAYQPADTYAPAWMPPSAMPATSVFAPSPVQQVVQRPVLTTVSDVPYPAALAPQAPAPVLAPPQHWTNPIGQTPAPAYQTAQAAPQPRVDLPANTWDTAIPAVGVPSRRATPSGLQREIDELRADRAGSVSGGGLWRGRNGDSGTSELSDFSTVIEGRFPVSEGGHLVLRLEPVFLSAGRISSTDMNASQQFGSNALANVSGAVGTTREQQDSGMAISVGYESAHLKLDLGTTPLGFQVQNVVGGVTYTDSVGDIKLKLDLSRRPVTDSLLSYAGTQDDVSGKTWGGVTATGGRLEVGVEEGRFGLFGYGGLHFLKGRNVVSNSRFEVGGGAYYKLIQDPDMEFTAGVSVTALGYKRNLRYFTLGHGGYFSPQRYFSINLPMELSGRTGRMAYRLDGSIGIQNFRENSAAYFPGDSTQQANWESVATANASAAPTGVSWRSFYPGQTKTGLGFRIGGEAEYRFAPQWVVGGRIAIDNASDYTQTSGLVYVKYHFEPIHTPVKAPPKTLKVGQ